MKVNKFGVEKNTILQPFAVNSSNVPTELLQLWLRLSTEIRKVDSGISIIFFLTSARTRENSSETTILLQSSFCFFKNWL